MTPISEFCPLLEREFDGDCTRERVFEFVRAHPIEPDSLGPYTSYCRDRYTRHLIHKTPRFEVLALCWDRGQVSRVHNHCDQECWMAVPDGKLLVQNYRVIAGSEQDEHCMLEPTDSFWMTPAAPAMVDPDNPIHSVGNPVELDRQTVSVHVYSYPYDRCMVYELGKDRAFEVELTYDSEYGRRG